MVQVTYPGVYVQEVPSGVRTITGVSTSVTVFIGDVQRGPVDLPVRVLSFADYERRFGTDTTFGEMTDQVRQFFVNGGTEAWVVRIAAGAASSQVVLDAADGTTAVLTLTAKDRGSLGDRLRVEIDYDTPNPEETFNLRVFREVLNAQGVLVAEAEETFSDLSMNQSVGRFVETVLEQQSTLIRATVDAAVKAAGAGDAGFSRSGVVQDGAATPGDKWDDLESLLDGTIGQISISVDGGPPTIVTLAKPAAGTANFDDAGVLATWTGNINSVLAPGNEVLVRTVTLSTQSTFEIVRATSGAPSVGSVRVAPVAGSNWAGVLQLGTDQGGIEVGRFGGSRPAPTGLFAFFDLPALDRFEALADAAKADLATLTLLDSTPSSPRMINTGLSGSTPMYVGDVFIPDPTTPSILGSLRNVQDNLRKIAVQVAPATTGDWTAEVQGFRLVLTATYGTADADVTANLNNGAAPTYDLDGAAGVFPATGTPPSTANARSYSLRMSTVGGDFQVGTSGLNGSPPELDDYTDAFEIIESNLDIFNLMVLPKTARGPDTIRQQVYGPASEFCRSRRAFLVLDGPESWTTVDAADAGIATFRVGLVQDHAAVYWPQITVPATGGTTKDVDPSGSVAGIMARIDANRGVFKAPAGIEADVRNVRGVRLRLSDRENGLINPDAINVIRVFPNGILVWGARTLAGFDNSGNDDYRYVPVRRLALFIEESLVRGLKFAVFEPNDEPLYGQIRQAAGAFMNNLFRQGAFQGQRQTDAYFVKCDRETTTQNDVNLGIVNVVVGFAPLRPAEFIVITIQQLAGQVQT